MDSLKEHLNLRMLALLESFRFNRKRTDTATTLKKRMEQAIYIRLMVI